MCAERRSRRRSRAETLSPTSGSGRWDTLCLTALVAAVLGMVLLFGGTTFWSSAPFWMLGLLAVCGCQVLALRSAGREKLQMSPPPGTLLWIWLCLFVWVRALIAPRIPYQAWTEGIQLSSGLLFYICFSDLCNRRNVWKWVLGAFLLLVCLTSMYALWLQGRGLRDVLWLTRPVGYEMRASGTFICPNHFAQVLFLGILLAVILLCMPAAGIPLRLLAGYTLFPALPALGLTLSRSGWLGLAAGLFTWFFTLALRKGWKRTLGTVAAWAVCATTLFFALWHLYPAFRTRVLHAKGDIRISGFWPDTWNMIQGEGFWGAGPGTYREVFGQYREHFSLGTHYIQYAHSEYLHLLSEYGWLAALALFGGVLACMIRLLRAGLRAEDESHAMIPLAMLTLLTAVMVHAVFDFNLHITGAALSLFLLLGCLDGRGLQLAVWKRKSLPPALARVLPWPALLTSFLLLCVYPLLFLGSLAEYRLDSAIVRNDPAAASTAAAAMRRWTPWVSRGWTELGAQYRTEAFWLREPEARAERIRQSRSAYETALRWNPYARQALEGLIELARMEKNTAEALVRVEQLVRLSPFDPQVRVHHGRALAQAGRIAEALEAFAAADRLKPGDRQILRNLQHLRPLLRERNPETP